jgi:hypothetical protein
MAAKELDAAMGDVDGFEFNPSLNRSSARNLTGSGADTKAGGRSSRYTLVAAGSRRQAARGAEIALLIDVSKPDRLEA